MASIFAGLIVVLLTVFLLTHVRLLIFSSAAGIAGDVDGNGKVDIVDIGIIIDNYGKNPVPNHNADINADGKVDIVDIGITIDNYGKTGTGGGGNSTYDQVNAAIDAYKAAHSGNGGKDWDINAKTDAQLAADPAAKQLTDLCGPGQRPVIPKIAWEYGGNDHQWINPGASALVYCVYIPTSSNTAHWKYDTGIGRVTADMYVKFPDQNPCKNQTGAAQVLNCLGDPTNSEILVDTISLDDGHRVGLELAEASTSVNLILPNGTIVFLLLNI